MNSTLLVSTGCALLGALLSAWLTRILCRTSSSLNALDYPNERSLHIRPTPRTGGIAILMGVAAGWAGWTLYIGDQWVKLGWVALAVAFIAVTSFIDDRRHIEPHFRFIAHCVAAAMVLYPGFRVEEWLPGAVNVLPAATTAAMTFLYVVWMVELYNFMDGIDGFAGGMTLVGFGGLAFLSGFGGAYLVAGLSLIVAAAALGFLLFNFPPAKIFMGDVGSATLGVLAAILSLWGAQTGAFPFWATVLVFSPFSVDATVTLARRAWRRERLWRPHTTHYYQRLVRLGWSHREVVLAEYVLMLATAASAVWVVRQPAAAQWALLATWALLYVALAWMVHALEAAARERFAADHAAIADPSNTP